MNREQLIQALVTRRLMGGDKNKVICICMAAGKTDRRQATRSNKASR